MQRIDPTFLSTAALSLSGIALLCFLLAAWARNMDFAARVLVVVYSLVLVLPLAKGYDFSPELWNQSYLYSRYLIRLMVLLGGLAGFAIFRRTIALFLGFPAFLIPLDVLFAISLPGWTGLLAWLGIVVAAVVTRPLVEPSSDARPGPKT